MFYGKIDNSGWESDLTPKREKGKEEGQSRADSCLSQNVCACVGVCA